MLSKFALSLKSDLVKKVNQQKKSANKKKIKQVATKRKAKIRYKKSGVVDFESLLIEGEGKKADVAVVTGSLGKSDSGLLKMRTNFLDFMAQNLGDPTAMKGDAK